MDNKWIKSDNVTKTFKLNNEPELIHIIKTGFNDKYIVVYEDAYELRLGQVIFGTKIEIETMFNINL